MEWVREYVLPEKNPETKYFMLSQHYENKTGRIYALQYALHSRT